MRHNDNKLEEVDEMKDALKRRARVLELVDDAIEKGFGQYFCLPNTSYQEFKSKYAEGLCLDKTSEENFILVQTRGI